MNPDEWVLDYLKTNLEASAVNEDFHEKFHKQFPSYARRETFCGAQPVARAMAALAALYEQKRIDRCKVCFVEYLPGFPKWVWSYSKKDL